MCVLEHSKEIALNSIEQYVWTKRKNGHNSPTDRKQTTDGHICSLFLLVAEEG